uniref:hypothetical protein n=1 Tax=Coxiella burnetii TaxID=777 RepID=UPI0022322DAB
HTKQVHALDLLNKQRAHADQEAVQALKRKLLVFFYKRTVSDEQHRILGDSDIWIGGWGLGLGVFTSFS